MRKALLMALAVCAAIVSHAQTVYPSGVTNCIARYNFSTTQTPVTGLPDVSGNAHHADTVRNLVSANSWRNRPGEAMQFNGMSSYAYIKNAPLLSPNAVTMVGLVKADNFFSGLCQCSQIICKGTPGYIPGQYGMSFTDDIYDNNCNNYDSARQQLIGYFNNSNVLSQSRPPAGNYVSKNTWYFIAVAYDGQQAVYYQAVMDSNNHINNLTPFYSSNTVGGTFGTSTQALSIGKHLNPAYPYWFNGKMDEVVLFNKVLTIAEMQTVYDYLWEVFAISPSFTQSQICQGSTFSLPYIVKANGAFGTMNSFLAQLSDATGSFTNPTLIGFVNSNTSGSITCNIHSSIPPGNGYRIRLWTTLPQEYSDVLPYNITIVAPSPAPTVSIVVNPGTNISAGQLVTFTANVVNGGTSPTYQWKKNGASIAGATLATYATNGIANADQISVVVRSSETCATPDSALSNVLEMKVSTSVTNNGTAIQQLQLYPNPNTGTLHISALAYGKDPVVYAIRNVIGQIVMQGTITAVNGSVNATLELPASAASGTYLLSLSQCTGKAGKTFTVQRN